MRSFERRLEEELPALRRYARVLVRDPSRAEDLVQDCLERALTRRQLWRPGSLRGWLFRMMRNLHLNELRRAGRGPATTQLDETLVGRQGSQALALEVAETLAAFDRLPEEQREVLLLVAVEEMSYREAARVLDVSEGTVASRVSRARERLRAILNGEQPVPLRRVK